MEKVKNENQIRIFGISIWNLCVYFIVFCILGFLLETVYAFVTKGVIESRKGFMYGPLCPIYGLGGIVLTMFLQYFKKNNFTLFLGGFVIGSCVEYIISFIAEAWFNVKWWDYSYMTFNINGRICLIYSIFWGLLAVPFMKIVYVHMENFAEYLEQKMGSKKYKRITAISISLLAVDFLVTMVALRVFSDRLIYMYDIDVANKEEVVEEYQRIMASERVKNFTEKAFSNEKMLRTYPNLKITKKDGTNQYAKDLITNITPYYYKVKSFDKTWMYKLSKVKEKMMNITRINIFAK